MKPIPMPIAEVYEELKNEVTWLHARWAVYRQLFGESDRRIELLNECAPAFFFIVQDVLFADVQVTLCKLTDEAGKGKRCNLSLEQLQERLESQGEKGLSGETRQILHRLQSECKPFREWRNKQLAHLDLSTSMRSNRLPGISRQMVEDALSRIRDFMNKIEQHYYDGDIGFEPLMISHDGNALVSVVRNGLRYDELVKQELIPYDDWLRAEWKDA